MADARLSFYPFDIPGLVGRYRSDSGVWVDSHTGRLGGWNDLSQSGNPLLPYTLGGAQPPILVQNAWDGKPVVRFTAANPNGEGMTTEDPPGVGAKAVPFTTGSVFVVLRLNSLPGSQFFLTTFSQSGVNLNRFTSLIENNAGTIVAAISMGATVPDTQPIGLGRTIASYVFNGAASRVRSNMRADTTGNAGGNKCVGWSVGGGFGSTTDADFAELLFYNRAVSTTEQATIETYLSQQWNVI